MLVLAFATGNTVAARAAVPSGNMGAFKFFDGKWKCVSGPTNNPMRDSATVSYEWDADGLIQRSEWDFVSSRTRQNGAHVRYYVTYDKQHRRFAEAGINSGESGGAMKSAGWSGNRIVWLGDPDDGSSGQYLFIRRSSEAFDVVYSERVRNKRTDLYIDHCKR